MGLTVPSTYEMRTVDFCRLPSQPHMGPHETGACITDTQGSELTLHCFQSEQAAVSILQPEDEGIAAVCESTGQVSLLLGDLLQKLE